MAREHIAFNTFEQWLQGRVRIERTILAGGSGTYTTGSGCHFRYTPEPGDNLAFSYYDPKGERHSIGREATDALGLVAVTRELRVVEGSMLIALPDVDVEIANSRSAVEAIQFSFGRAASTLTVPNLLRAYHIEGRE